jgi:hypothetical protein
VAVFDPLGYEDDPQISENWPKNHPKTGPKSFKNRSPKSAQNWNEMKPQIAQNQPLNQPKNWPLEKQNPEISPKSAQNQAKSWSQTSPKIG